MRLTGLMDPAGCGFVGLAKSAPRAESRRGLLMSRRTLLGVMAGSLLGAPLAARGQEVREVKIGLLTERSLSPPYIEALRRGLMELRRGDGSFRIEHRSAEGKLERLPGLAAELIGSGVNVIVTGLGSPAALAAKKATATVPIVFVTGGDHRRLRNRPEPAQAGREHHGTRRRHRCHPGAARNAPRHGSAHEARGLPPQSG